MVFITQDPDSHVVWHLTYNLHPQGVDAVMKDQIDEVYLALLAVLSSQLYSARVSSALKYPRHSRLHMHIQTMKATFSSVVKRCTICCMQSRSQIFSADSQVDYISGLAQAITRLFCPGTPDKVDITSKPSKLHTFAYAALRNERIRHMARTF